MRLFPVLFAVFLAIPLVEIYILIEVGQVLGAPLTILSVVGTALLGAVLARYQGMVTVTRLYTQLNTGELPGQTLFDGACLVFAGALLLTPGFFTDAVGFALLTPPLRRWAYRRLQHHLIVRTFGSGGGPGGPREPEEPGPTTIEGEFRHRDSDRDH
ncbi:FxsA family protein [Thiohalorhabdus sp.]|uniref:FxsA family protein n=1 Tax=Thiohalorhabdus sp. TaxID=3094134 RepID=UPI002FC34321